MIMDETRRFLRYITPGVLFVILTLFLLWIVLPEWTINLLKICVSLHGNSIAIIIGYIFTSGVLGYLFATVHHWCHWHLSIDQNVINHTEQIKSLRERGLIRIPPLVDVSKDPRLEALIIMSILWFERLQIGNPISNSEKRVTIFGDLAHAAGTARVASTFALIVTITVCTYAGSWSPSTNHVMRFIVMATFGIAICYLFHDAYRRTGKIYQQLNDRILEDALEKESDAGL